jgi:hypothetical protein
VIAAPAGGLATARHARRAMRSVRVVMTPA